MDISSAGGNNALRRRERRVVEMAWGGERGQEKRSLCVKGQFAGNFKNATPWSARNEISQRILIRLRPRGGPADARRPFDTDYLTLRAMRRGGSCGCRRRCQGKRTRPHTSLDRRIDGWNIARRCCDMQWGISPKTRPKVNLSTVKLRFATTTRFIYVLYFDASIATWNFEI